MRPAPPETRKCGRSGEIYSVVWRSRREIRTPNLEQICIKSESFGFSVFEVRSTVDRFCFFVVVDIGYDG